MHPSRPRHIPRALSWGTTASALVVLMGCSHVPKSLNTGRQLPAPEVKKLFAGKTVTSKNLGTGVVSVSRYAPDGRVQQQRQGQQRTGTWRVMPDGKMCLRMENRDESCRWIRQETDGRYQKYAQQHAFARPVITYIGLMAPRAAAQSKKPAVQATASAAKRSGPVR